MRLWTTGLLGLCCMVIAAFSGCGGAPPGEEVAVAIATPETTEEPVGTVEVTSYPMAWAVGRLAGPVLDVQWSAAAAADPSSWRPTPSELETMRRADLIVVGGVRCEPWLDEVALPVATVVDTTLTVRDRLLEPGEAGEASACGTWLDPMLLVEQTRAVLDAAGALWPEHRERFVAGLAQLEADLTALDGELLEATSAAGEHRVLLQGPVLRYLDRRYELGGVVVSLDSEAGPTSEQWTQVERAAGGDGSAVMLWSSEPRPEAREGLTERGVDVVVLDPCTAPPEEGDYLAAMRRNAEALGAVLQR